MSKLLWLLLPKLYDYRFKHISPFHNKAVSDARFMKKRSQSSPFHIGSEYSSGNGLELKPQSIHLPYVDQKNLNENGVEDVSNTSLQYQM